MLGRMLGQYRVESELGAGGMGVVYEGTDCGDAWRKTGGPDCVTSETPVSSWKKRLPAA